ncbi:hypothetical protein ACH4A8_39300 [Streptomyces vietnamensis]|uniref:hypothetical protein n=1 Tax=Streptomyces vietnamensis TaxID=362257 RepID=UPI0037BC9D48
MPHLEAQQFARAQPAADREDYEGAVFLIDGVGEPFDLGGSERYDFPEWRLYELHAGAGG